jgi:hypothetical protein
MGTSVSPCMKAVAAEPIEKKVVQVPYAPYVVTSESSAESMEVARALKAAGARLYGRVTCWHVLPNCLPTASSSLAWPLAASSFLPSLASRCILPCGLATRRILRPGLACRHILPGLASRSLAVCSWCTNSVYCM